MMRCELCNKETKHQKLKMGRTIKTLEGDVHINYVRYRCKVCGLSFTENNGIAPVASRYGYDVINLILDERRKGLKFREIYDRLLKEGLDLSIATISTIYNRNETVSP